MAEKTPNNAAWYEPDSQAEFSQYPYNHVQQTESGHSLEFDDTPDYERIRLQHRIGNYTEIQSNGDEIHKIVGDNYEIVVKNNHVLIKGYCTVTIQGDSIMNVEGDVYQKVTGDVNQKIQGDLTCAVSGEATLSAEGDVNVTAGGLTGQVNLNAPFGVHINSDLTVSGAISSLSTIYAADNLVAGKKAYAIQGMSTLGGLNVGAPDTPGPMPPGVINATTQIDVPVVNALVLNDLYGPVHIMRAVFTTHKHPAPKGITGVPFKGQF
jgi:hypothetical protein